jgi:hypothetical protein
LFTLKLFVMSMKGEKETTKDDELRSGNLVLQAVNQLCSHFEAYSDIPKITELREKFKGIKDMLKSHIFSDFSRCIPLSLPCFMTERDCLYQKVQLICSVGGTFYVLF